MEILIFLLTVLIGGAMLVGGLAFLYGLVRTSLVKKKNSQQVMKSTDL